MLSAIRQCYVKIQALSAYPQSWNAGEPGTMQIAETMTTDDGKNSVDAAMQNRDTVDLKVLLLLLFRILQSIIRST